MPPQPNPFKAYKIDGYAYEIETEPAPGETLQGDGVTTEPYKVRGPNFGADARGVITRQLPSGAILTRGFRGDNPMALDLLERALSDSSIR